MGISNLDFQTEKPFKLSYDAVGFPLDKDIYPDGLRSDQKRSILRSIISRERKKSDLRVVWKDKGWNRLLWKIKQKIADLLWKGRLSESKDLQRHNYLVCGKYGVHEQDKDVNNRLRVFHCNQMKRCPVCSKRYHIGRSYERGKVAAAVMQANKIEHLRKFNLTLPDFLWNQIKDADDMRVFVKLANKMLQEFYGCPMKGVHGYLNGSVGIHIQVHPHSSEEAWRKKPHLHCYVIPLKLDDGHAKNVDRFISEADLKRLKAAWSVSVKRACVKLGYKRIDEIPDELVIFHKYINLPKNFKDKGRPGFNFRYDQRSPAEDLEKSVIAMDFNQELAIMAFNQSGYDYHAIWSFNDYVAEILKRLNLKGTNSTYGWLRRFKHYAPALGVEVEKEKDLFIPVPELSISTEYWREYKGRYNKEKERVEQVKIVHVRLLRNGNNPGAWFEVDPWKIQGEEIWTGSKKRYTYSVAKGKRPPDRGG